MSKNPSKFNMMMARETAGMKLCSFKQNEIDSLKEGQYIKFMHGIDPEHKTRMIGKIRSIGFSKNHQCKYFETITDYGYYTTIARDIYKVYRPKLKEKIKADRTASCIVFKNNHSEELPYMISTLNKMKNYISRKNLGEIVTCDIIDNPRSYKYELTVSYPNTNNVVTYSIPNRNAHNISFHLKNKRKPFTFKVRNRQGKIDLNFEKVKRMIKRFMNK